jgi:hypothetical protein
MSSSKHSEYWTEEHLKSTEKWRQNSWEEGDIQENKGSLFQSTISLGFRPFRAGKYLFTSSVPSK